MNIPPSNRLGGIKDTQSADREEDLFEKSEGASAEEDSAIRGESSGRKVPQVGAGLRRQSKTKQAEEKGQEQIELEDIL